MRMRDFMTCAESALGLERNPDLGSAVRRSNIEISADLHSSHAHVLKAAAAAYIRRYTYPIVTEGDQEQAIVDIHGG